MAQDQQGVPQEPPKFLEAIKGKTLKEILTDEMIEPHVYLTILIIITIIVAFIIALAI